MTPTKISSSQSPSELNRLLPTIILATIGIIIILLATAIYSKKGFTKPAGKTTHIENLRQRRHRFFRKSQILKKEGRFSFSKAMLNQKATTKLETTIFLNLNSNSKIYAA